jgi:hypothetical protein
VRAVYQAATAAVSCWSASLCGVCVCAASAGMTGSPAVNSACACAVLITDKQAVNRIYAAALQGVCVLQRALTAAWSAH